MTVPTFGHSSKNQEKTLLILNFTTFSSFKVFHVSKAKRREKIILDHYLLRCTIAFFCSSSSSSCSFWGPRINTKREAALVVALILSIILGDCGQLSQTI